MITRPTFALNYAAGDPTQPPPLNIATPPRCQALPTRGRMFRAGTVELVPNGPRYMADLTDPSTWQRPYRFT